MIIFEKVSELQIFIQSQKLNNKRIGFVPTMGALHQGHLSLIKLAQADCEITVASIFVNPTQFNDAKDFDKYPRMNKEDIALLESVNCDVLFLPTVNEMYQNRDLEIIPIEIGHLDTILEGEKRPGHYIGVVTIVEKLFRAVMPDRVYLGLKDFQQVKVIEKLVRDKNLPIDIVGCPTLREENGLAMSSRNLRLTEQGRAIAGRISQALYYVKSHKNQLTPNQIIHEAIQSYLSIPDISIEYLELRNAYDLSEVDMNQWKENQDYVVLFAGKLEEVRLIDNVTL